MHKLSPTPHILSLGSLCSDQLPFVRLEKFYVPDEELVEGRSKCLMAIYSVSGILAIECLKENYNKHL